MEVCGGGWEDRAAALRRRWSRGELGLGTGGGGR